MNKVFPLGVALALALCSLGATKAFGCEQHFPDGTIGNCPDQSCADFIDPGDGTYCVECPIAFYDPNNVYITYDQKLAEAWIVTGKKPVRIMSDKYVAFSKTMQEKYGKLKRDKEVNQKIKLEVAAFFETDDHKVSPERLKQSSKSLNLKVRDDAKISENESPRPVNRKAGEPVPGLDFPTRKVGDPIPGVGVPLDGDTSRRIDKPAKGSTKLPGIFDRWGNGNRPKKTVETTVQGAEPNSALGQVSTTRGKVVEAGNDPVEPSGAPLSTVVPTEDK